MKGKSAKKPKDHPLKLEINWQSVSELQVSMRKILRQQSSVSIKHQNLETIIKACKQILRIVDIVKSQQKNFMAMQQNYDQIQSKLNNHENIISSIQKTHLQRLKAITDQNKMSKQHYEKAKKHLIESQEQAKHQLAEVKKENTELRFKVELLQKEKQSLLKQQELQLQQIQKLKQLEKKYKDLLSTVEKKLPEPSYDIKQNQSLFQEIICSNCGPKLLEYLLPQDIISLQLLSKKCQIFLKKSNKCQIATYKSILGHKNKIIRYYHKHIQYFEQIYMKIPEQILQLAFYRYEIVKQNIGVDILQILNRSAMLFQGKFVEEGEQYEERQEGPIEISQEQINLQLGKVSEYNQNARQNIQDFQDPKQGPHYKQNIAEQVHTILQIDPDIVKQYLHEQKSQRIKSQKDINLMYKKIQDTAQLYSADVESIGLFLKNILKNFSKVFVLSKNLYTQSRNLQSLNSFILHQLSNWHKIKIKYTSQIQDLKAQLQAESRLKLFFSEKSLKSQQKALGQQNMKLTIQTKYNKQTQKLDQICRDKQQMQGKLETLQKHLKNLQNENKQIRKAYEQGRDKYKKIIEQLSVVKETIIRMNVM